ncbi:MAG: ferrous iron transport protein B [Bacteroidia bacterium]
MKQEITVALVGNPNSGKTSLFNALTGLNQKVSNFPGTTVDKKTGSCRLSPLVKAQLIDLPGTYSLYPKSADELVTYEMLRNKTETGSPDIVLFIADASNLKRNLLLMTQVADLGIPVILALNMMDVAARRGIFYNIELLSAELGIPVIPINARQKKGISELKTFLVDTANYQKKTFFSLDALQPAFLNEVCEITDKKNRYAALQFAINARELLTPKADAIRDCFIKYQFDAHKFQETEVLKRYHTIDQAVRISRKEKGQTKLRSITQQADKILTHRIWGLVIFLSLLFFVFQAIFSWSSYPMQWVEDGFYISSHWIQQTMPAGILNDLIVSGILAGLSGVMVFLPQIIILFAFIAILEDVGYMARVGFIMDRIMRPFGMNGKSIVPLISGMACAVPSIMASRSIENKKERLITILVIPLMSCSARLPVYTLLIGMLVPEDMRWGPFNLHGIVLMFMYLIGFVAVLISAFIFQLFIKTREKNYFIMELPGYKLPVLSNMLITLYEKGKAFVWGAGKIIVAVSVILWALASFGPNDTMQHIETKYLQLATDPANTHPIEELAAMKDAEKLQNSYAGQFGHWMEPVIRPLGFDWKIGIALITSLAAREVFVGTMSTIYSVGSDIGDLQSIRVKMRNEINPATGNPVFSMATVLSLMIFYAFALQCMSTISVVHEETRSWKWTFIQFAYLTALAYISSWVIFNAFS